MDHRELSLVVYPNSMEQVPNKTGVVEAAGSIDQEYENASAVDMLALTMVPVHAQHSVHAQHLNALVNMNPIKQINDALKDQIDEFIKELRALKKAEDPEHGLAIVVSEAGVAKNGGKKRGRKPTNELVGPISVTFELPDICYRNNVDIEAVLATEYPEHPRRFSLFERAKNWKMELRLRPTGRMRDVYYDHLPSNIRLRIKNDVIRYVLYEKLPKKREDKRKTSKKRKLAIVAIDNNQDSGSTASASSINQMASDPMMEESENFQLKNKMIEYFPDKTDQELEIGVNNKMMDDSVVEEKYEESGERQMENENEVKDDFFDINPEEIEMEIKKIMSGQMVESSEKSREVQDMGSNIIEDYFDGPKEIGIEMSKMVITDHPVVDKFEKSGEKQ